MAVVESEHEIISIVIHHATRLNTLLGIVNVEDVQWQVSVALPKVW